MGKVKHSQKQYITIKKLKQWCIKLKNKKSFQNLFLIIVHKAATPSFQFIFLPSSNLLGLYFIGSCTILCPLLTSLHISSMSYSNLFVFTSMLFRIRLLNNL